MTPLTLGQPGGQGWPQLAALGAAFVLTTAIGLEREWHQKAAGLRTHALVGVGAALFMLVSKYGFEDVLAEHVAFDPSRVAAQIVSGIGFIGGGLIFIRRDVVSGLTTAASIWVAAAVGAAAGADLPLLATVTTALYFLIVSGLGRLTRRLSSSPMLPSGLSLDYQYGRGVLRDVLAECTARGFTISHLTTRRAHPGEGDQPATVTVWLEVQGRAPAADLAVALGSLDGVLNVDLESGRSE